MRAGGGPAGVLATPGGLGGAAGAPGGAAAGWRAVTSLLVVTSTAGGALEVTDSHSQGAELCHDGLQGRVRRVRGGWGEEGGMRRGGVRGGGGSRGERGGGGSGGRGGGCSGDEGECWGQVL